MKVDSLFASQCILGESPLWHAERNCCYWVDIERGILYEYNWLLQTTKNWNFNQKLSLVREGKSNELILALGLGIARFDLETEQLSPIFDLESSGSGNRCNDGACDSLGRLWIGTMHLHHKKDTGALYMIDTHLKVEKKISNTSISNGIAWSLDNKRMYYIDSPTQAVQSFISHEHSGKIIFEKNVINVPEDLGTPDGMTIDEEGMLWIAHWGGFGIYRWDPNGGKLLEKIELPVPQVTSCTFAGEDLDYLIVTTASENLNEQELKKYPLSGNTFFIKMDLKGFLSNKCLL